ncbi:MAG: hypothetical protein U1F57_01790 [bacterium]
MGDTPKSVSAAPAGFHLYPNDPNGKAPDAPPASYSAPAFPLACVNSSAYSKANPKFFVCDATAGPMSYGFFSEKPKTLAQAILQKHPLKEMVDSPQAAFFNYFKSGESYPLTEENRALLLQLDPRLASYLSSLPRSVTGISPFKTEYRFSFENLGETVTPEGFKIPNTQLQFFRNGDGEISSPNPSGGSGRGIPTGETPPTPSKLNSVQMSLLLIGGTILLYAGMEKAGVPEKLQGPILLGTTLAAPAALKSGLSLFGGEPLTWNGFKGQVNALGNSWAYFAPYQLGSAILLSETGIAKYGTNGNKYGSLLIGATPFVAARWLPQLKPWVGMEGGAATALGAEATLGARGLAVVSTSVRRFIPVVGGLLMADTVTGWSVGLGDAITGQDKDDYRKLWKFTQHLMMTKDFGNYPMSLMGHWMGLWADVGDTIGKVSDHFSGKSGNGAVERQAADFIKVSDEWGKAMRQALFEIDGECQADGKRDMSLLQKRIHELYQGKSGPDILNAYFLLTYTGYSAKEAQAIKELIGEDGGFNTVRMEQYLNTETRRELKVHFSDFMEDRLIQFARQSFRMTEKGETIDWALFQRKVSDFYEQNQAAMKELYASPAPDFRSGQIQRLISKDGVLLNVSGLDAHLTEVLRKKYP